ncbi:unnamed protein product [Allacma fusca]|uniref:Uncharacterized protein n=1 Tax=Allacma fusca TaxID=39272 RepID=A0A8J2P464_9HEXA|nr:unnamed protein product [Allacma fusca]
MKYDLLWRLWVSLEFGWKDELLKILCRPSLVIFDLSPIQKYFTREFAFLRISTKIVLCSYNRVVKSINIMSLIL